MNDIVKYNSNKSFKNHTRFQKEHYTIHDHVRFLDTELHYQNINFLKTINCKAVDLLSDGKLLPAKFIKIENGQLIVKTSKQRTIPRKGEYLTAVLLEGDMADNRNWNYNTWYELRVNNQIAISEAICIWQEDAKDSNFNFIGFRGISLEFASKLIEDCVIIFGPKEPPKDYLINLKQLIELKTKNSIFLDFDYIENNWNPLLFDNKLRFPSFVINQLCLSPYLIVQGPPGTGKTFKLAELLEKLLDEGNNVLVTALTNRALIELAKKPNLQKAINLGLVTKKNLTIDEINEIPGLQNTRKDGCIGELTLATFYISSAEALKYLNPYYDYVIMDEASQALLSMFEATVRLGKKVIWIGDQNQLPPIAEIDEKEIKHQMALPLIEGMKTVCDVFNFPSIMLNQTFRLSNRGAEFTSKFYNKEIMSAKHEPKNYIYNELSKELQFLFHKDGGPFWLQIKMPIGEDVPFEAIYLISQLTNQIHKSNIKLEISILTKLKKTVTQLQLAINTIIGKNDKILVDTVERVQGMTCDICIFLIPNKCLSMSLNQSFFNVATSRASRHTIIVADKEILKSSVCKGGTRQYLEELSKNTDSIKLDSFIE